MALPKGRTNNPKGKAKGTLNKSTAEIKALSQAYGPAALTTLATIMRNSDNDQARMAAAKELLDRGYGKTTQMVEHSGAGGGPVQVMVNFVTPGLKAEE
jgi:hypothetical protein